MLSSLTAASKSVGRIKLTFDWSTTVQNRPLENKEQVFLHKSGKAAEQQNVAIFKNLGSTCTGTAPWCDCAGDRVNAAGDP